MDFLELAQARYSVRKFDSRPVEEEKLALLLEAARLAPTAKNSQPWHIYVIRSEEALAKANLCSPCIYGAPLALLICYDVSQQVMIDINEINLGLVDASIVTTHLMLAAADLGLGSCWVARFNAAQACDLFDLPDTMEPAAMLPLGYSLAEPAQRHLDSKPLDELVTWL